MAAQAVRTSPIPQVVRSDLMAKLRTSPALLSAQKHLQSHPIYNSIQTRDHMRTFMKSHSFAVWDFMVLLKALQRNLTCVQTIWTPPKNNSSARFINSIVLGEESDEIGHNHFMSHYELYLHSMNDMGADTMPIQTFVQRLTQNSQHLQTPNSNHINFAAVQSLLNGIAIPQFTKNFVLNTLTTVNQPLPAIAASFCLGREDPIPQMFQKFIDHINEGDKSYTNIRAYLQRHIDVDGEDHGPLSFQLLNEICEGDETKEQMVVDAGVNAIVNRIKLWDGIYSEIKSDAKMS